jgi:hypothetical protein
VGFEPHREKKLHPKAKMKGYNNFLESTYLYKQLELTRRSTFSRKDTPLCNEREQLKKIYRQ